MQAKPKWNNCTKITANTKTQNAIKVTKKESKKECEKKSKELMARNQKWVKEKDKKLFEKARSQFLRMKQLCYFSPKIL